MISSVNVTKSTVSSDLVTFTEEILNGKLHFCAVFPFGTRTSCPLFSLYVYTCYVLKGGKYIKRRKVSLSHYDKNANCKLCKTSFLTTVNNTYALFKQLQIFTQVKQKQSSGRNIEKQPARDVLEIRCS